MVHFKVKLEMEGKASGGEQGAEVAGDTAAAAAAAAGIEAEATRQARLAKMVRETAAAF